MLGNTDVRAAVDPVVRGAAGPSGRYLHHNFVVALLSDLFGIQSRGGCSCAGPYGHRLLGIDIERSHEFEHEITHGCEGIKPGWTRVSFNYFISETVFQYLVDAVDLVAEHGWKLLPEYRFDPATGLWRHRDGPVEPPLRLSQLSYDPATGELRAPAARRASAPARTRSPATSTRPATASRPRRRATESNPRPARCRPSSSTSAGSTCRRNRWLNRPFHDGCTFAAMSQDVIDRFNHLVAEFDARVQAAPADSWGNAAPCDGWTATDVVDHVASNANGLVAGLTGTEAAQFDKGNVVASWGETRDRVLATVGTADLSQQVAGPFGPMPAEQLIGRLICTDVLVHTWDLARAVGGDERLDADAVAGAYSGLKPMDAMLRMPGVFGPKIEPADGDDAQTEFLKFLGRAV